jgi:glycosyltransferase involved in cell wall biosynthesis
MGRFGPSAIRAAFVGTYPPRQCGIATFTSDLAEAVTTAAPVPVAERGPVWPRPGPARPPATVDIVAIDEEERDFPVEVRLRLRPDRPADYLGIADRLNRTGYDVVSVQHEFGIYGGPDGVHVLHLLDELEVPVVTTFHTVRAHPSDHQRRILREIGWSSSRVVVLSEAAARRLPLIYDIDPATVRVIPHGVPDLPFVDPATIKPLVGLSGRPTVLSFGLLGPGKGYELAIRAMSGVVRDVPNVCYVILGATHPDLRRREGEAYRESLQTLVAELGLERHIQFVDAYVDLSTLGRWLQAADVFVTPYPGAEQVVSGTLAYALGTGKALVSTPYAYARELLAGGRGQLVPFGDSLVMGREISRFLTDQGARDRARALAYDYGRRMTWPVVGAAYRTLFTEVVAEAAASRVGRLRTLRLDVAPRNLEATTIG